MLRPLITSIALALLLSAHATDRVVSPSGTYNTISSAIAASSDGDRILVESGNYNEIVTLSRSLSILPLVEGTRYKVLQELRIENADGKTILVSGMRAQYVKLYGIYTTRTLVRFVDSYMFNLNCVDPFTRVELYRDTIGTANISSGAVIGNVLGINVGALASGRLDVSGTSNLPEEVMLIGNHFGRGSLDPEIHVTNSATFRFENNYVEAQNPPTFYLERPENLTGPPSYIVNNTFSKPNLTNDAVMQALGITTQSLVVKNNATVNYGLGILDSPPPQVVLGSSNNLLAAPSWINSTTGASLGGTPLVNAGDPDPRYLDLDLTTNDVGCYGGSNSRENFTTGMGSAVVGFMQAPRVVSQGDAVNISATGFDR